MTAQEIFDTVVNNLRQQGCKSQKRINYNVLICAYRGDNKTKCAAGHLISDDEYLPSMEGKDIMDVTFCSSELTAKFGEHIQLVGDLQQIHDNQLVSFWENKFKILAETYNLVYTLKD